MTALSKVELAQARAAIRVARPLFPKRTDVVITAGPNTGRHGTVYATHARHGNGSIGYVIDLGHSLLEVAYGDVEAAR